MAPRGNPSVQNWYVSDGCPLISAMEDAWDLQVLFHLMQVIEKCGVSNDSESRTVCLLF